MTLFACHSGSSFIPEARADEYGGETASGVAVVELFTSEGCSSCPPADSVLADLVRSPRSPRSPRSADRPVYVLSFHVDYWDELGWPDRFASADNTARQRSYAHAFGTRGVYTPQMIVDGTEQFTGSNRDRADAAIARALARPASVRLSVQVRAAGANEMTIGYTAPGAPAGSVLNVAVVESAADTSVRAGENAGKLLHHVNVVREFVTVPVTSPTGWVTVHVPRSLSRDRAELIAYVQRMSGVEGGMPVLGAARSALANP